MHWLASGTIRDEGHLTESVHWSLILLTAGRRRHGTVVLPFIHPHDEGAGQDRANKCFLSTGKAITNSRPSDHFDKSVQDVMAACSCIWKSCLMLRQVNQVTDFRGRFLFLIHPRNQAGQNKEYNMKWTTRYGTWLTCQDKSDPQSDQNLLPKWGGNIMNRWCNTTNKQTRTEPGFCAQ